MDGHHIRATRLAFIITLAVAITACSTAAPSVSTAAPSVSTSPGAASSLAAGTLGTLPSGDPLAPYPSKTGDLPEVVIAQSTPQLSFAPFLVAQDMNFFEYQGVKLKFIQLQSGTTTFQALQSGSVDLVASASTEVAKSQGLGKPTQAIQNIVMMTQQLCVRDSWLKEHNVTPQSTMEEKMAAMKGAIFGISGPGAASDLYPRYLLRKYGHLDPDTDATFVQLQGTAAQGAALDADQAQAFFTSPPSCAIAKHGVVLVDPTRDTPEFENYTHEVLYTTKDWLKENKERATAAATAMSMGSNFILQHPDAAEALLEKDFSKVDPGIIAEQFEKYIKPAVRPDGKFDQSMWENDIAVFKEAKIIPDDVGDLDPSEGVLWTNEYIVDATIR